MQLTAKFPTILYAKMYQNYPFTEKQYFRFDTVCFLLRIKLNVGLINGIFFMKTDISTEFEMPAPV